MVQNWRPPISWFERPKLWGINGASPGAHRLLPGCDQLHAVHPALRRASRAADFWRRKHGKQRCGCARFPGVVGGGMLTHDLPMKNTTFYGKSVEGNGNLIDNGDTLWEFVAVN